MNNGSCASSGRQMSCVVYSARPESAQRTLNDWKLVMAARMRGTMSAKLKGSPVSFAACSTCWHSWITMSSMSQSEGAEKGDDHTCFDAHHVMNRMRSFTSLGCLATK